MLTALFNPWVLLGGLLAILGAFGAGYASNDGADKVQAAWDRANAVAVDLRGKRIAKAREEERLLREAAEKERKERHAQEERLRVELAAALGELRKRPRRPAATRPADVPQPAPGPGPAGGGGCTGADLFGDDAELLVRFATTAQRIKSQRDACYSRYQAAQERLRLQGKP